MKKLLALILLTCLLLSGCAAPLPWRRQPGLAWAPGSFDSNGERIYFTSTNYRGEWIRYRGGPDVGNMMMGQVYACASCHGPDARGGVHVMHGQVMDAPDIRWSTLAEHEDEEHSDEPEGYGLETFRMAVVEGEHPDGEPLDGNMPRWRMDDQDVADLAEYLQSLP